MNVFDDVTVTCESLVDAITNSFSVREWQVFRLSGYGFSAKQVATQLGIGEKTAQTHRSRGMSRLGLHREAEVAVAVWRVRYHHAAISEAIAQTQRSGTRRGRPRLIAAASTLG